MSITFPQKVKVHATLLSFKIVTQSGARLGEIRFKTRSGKKVKAHIRSEDLRRRIMDLGRGARVFMALDVVQGQTAILTAAKSFS